MSKATGGHVATSSNGRPTEVLVEPSRLRPSAALHGRLPVPASTFVGRRDDLTRVGQGLDVARVVTLTGLSGMGKTRTAVEVAGRVARQYPDGVWLVDVARAAEPDRLPMIVSAALGVPAAPGRKATDTLCTYLRHRRTLLLLDNCEPVAEAASALVQRLLAETADVTVLATSHRPLGISGEQIVPVLPMSLPDVRAGGLDRLTSDAVALFCSRATAARSGDFRLSEDVVHAVVEICRRLDGIPLAIELAAARAAVLTPGEIAQRLENRFALLARGSTAFPPRHATLRAALDWTYDLLPLAEAALLRRLSVFAGGATIGAVENVCTGKELGPAQVLDALSELVARSLVVADTSGVRARYHLLESVWHHGVERLANAGESTAYHARHAECCAVLAEATPDLRDRNQREPSGQLGSEVDNLRGALEWASDGVAPELALRLAVALTPFWRSRGCFGEGRVWLERGLASAPSGFESLRASALWGVGIFAFLQGEGASAGPWIEESLALARTSRCHQAEARALTLLGFVALVRQDPVSAMPLLERGVDLARTTADASCLRGALCGYGRAQLFLGEATVARELFEECLDLMPDDDSAEVLIGLAWAALIAGEQRRGHELLRRALAASECAETPLRKALVLSFLGDLARLAGDGADARSRFDEGRRLASAIGARFAVVRCTLGLARLRLDDHDVAGAKALLDEAMVLVRDPRLPYAYVRCLHLQGLVRWAGGDASGSRASFEEALADARRSRDGAGVSGAMHQLARLDRHEDNGRRAASAHAEAIVLQAAVPDVGAVACSLEGLAGVAVDHRRYVPAARLFGAAAALRDRSGSSRPIEERACYHGDVARVEAEIGTPPMQQAWAEGAALGCAEAVALATRGRGSRGRPAHGWGSLTRSERQVVELAAAGLTNNEIGQKLFVSGRTVQGHLRRAFPKLDVTRRRQLREVVGRRQFG